MAGELDPTILIVDRDPDFTERACSVLSAAGYGAGDGTSLALSDGAPEATTSGGAETPTVILVDIGTVESNSDALLARLRSRLPGTAILLTGERPPDSRTRDWWTRHDVFGYHDKRHGEEALLSWVEAAVSAVARARAGDSPDLATVLDALPRLHEVQPMIGVLDRILDCAHALLGSGDAFAAVRLSDPVGSPGIEGFSPWPSSIGEYEVLASRGRFPVGIPVGQMGAADRARVEAAIGSGRPEIDDSAVILPLALGEHVLGLALLEVTDRPSPAPEALRILCIQGASAIRNAALYELATVDPTTRAYRKSFVLERLRQTVKLAWRQFFPVSVLMVDIDRFKELKDEWGHLAGDRALRHVADLLKENVRDTDIVGRFGGDEFVVILIDADLEGTRIVADRVWRALEGRSPPEGLPTLRLSVGSATLAAREREEARAGPFPDFRQLVEALVDEADGRMYEAKKRQAELITGETLVWKDHATE